MAGSPDPTVAVVGMRALRRDLNRMADDTASPVYAQIKAAGKTAAEPVAAATRGSLPHTSNRLSGDVRVSGTKTGAAVRMGRVAIPYAGWIEFGGSRPDGSTREFIPTGRYLFPAARGLADVAAGLYSDALQRAINDPSVWTNTTDNPQGVTDG
jgi:hypothetical protein